MLVTPSFLAWLLLAGLFALLGIGGLNASEPRRVLLVALFALSVIAGGWLVLEQTGRPRPASWEWRDVETEVIAAQLEPGVAIWVWTRRKGDLEPISYRMSWDEGLAEFLEEAREATTDNADSLMMVPQWYKDPTHTFYVRPPPQPPSKN